MAFDFVAVSWEDEDGESHTGMPYDLSETYGIKVVVSDPDTGEIHQFWAYVPEPFDYWEEWLDYIGGLCEMHGMDLA